MPWTVRKKPVKGKKDWAILKKVGGRWRTVGRSRTKKNARASVRARRAGAHR